MRRNPTRDSLAAPKGPPLLHTHLGICHNLNLVSKYAKFGNVTTALAEEFGKISKPGKVRITKCLLFNNNYFNDIFIKRSANLKKSLSSPLHALHQGIYELRLSFASNLLE